MKTKTSSSSLVSYVPFGPQIQELLTEEKRPMLVLIVLSIAQGIMLSAATIFGFVYMNDYGLKPHESTFYASFLRLPWSIKPLWGIMSDSFPLCGYKRKSYLLLTSLLGWMGLFFFGSKQLVPPFALGLFCLLCHYISQSFQSVLGQAIVVENAQKKNREKGSSEEDKSKSASHGISMFYGTKIIGQVLLSTCIALFFNRDKRHTFLFYISFVPLIVFSVALLLPEKRQRKEADLLLGSSSQEVALMSDSTLLESETPQRPSVSRGLSNSQKAWQFMKKPLMYKAWILIFLSHFAPTSGELRTYYYANHLKFEDSFWGVVNNLAYIATFCGIVVYHKYFSNVSMKSFYTVTLLIVFVLHLSMLLLYLGYTDKWGINNKLFVGIENLITAFNAELHHLPILVMACRLCPKNIEATVFAIFIAASNMAGFFSAQSGAFLLKVLKITESNFDNLYLFSIISAIVPFFSLCLLYSIDYEKALKEVEDFNEKTPSRRGTLNT